MAAEATKEARVKQSPTHNLSLHVADTAGLRWAQRMVAAHHYLRKPVDVRCRPLCYLVEHRATWGVDAAAFAARIAGREQPALPLDSLWGAS